MTVISPENFLIALANSGSKIVHEESGPEHHNPASAAVVRSRQGKGFYKAEERRWVIEEGMACIALPAETGCFCSIPEERSWEIDHVILGGELGASLSRAFVEKCGRLIALPETSPAELALRHLIRTGSGKDPYEQGMAAYGFLLAWWRQVNGTWREFANPVEEAVRFCKTQQRLRIGVNELAAMAGMSREHFSRIFREKMGVSPSTYLQKRRLQLVGELIKGTRLPLGEIAIRCGFSSKRRMLRTYVQKYGSIPSRAGNQGLE